MNPALAAQQLAASARAIEALVRPLADEAARWRPAPSRWSVLEVVNHLADEEVEDFRTRVDLTLHRPQDAWPPIDPAGWVGARRYAERDPQASLGRWLGEREMSLAWLAGLGAASLARTHVHPTLGPFRADELLASWVAHDLLHLRQITRLLFEQLAPHSTRYAGDW